MTEGSPWTPARMAIRLRLDDIAWTPGGELAWLEGRSDRGTVMLRGLEGGVRELTPEHSVRAGVGYGGGDFAFDHEALLFVERIPPEWLECFDVLGPSLRPWLMCAPVLIFVVPAFLIIETALRLVLRGRFR